MIKFNASKETGGVTNLARAGKAFRRLFPFGEDKNQSIDEHVTDAIANLGHLCDCRHADFEKCIKTALKHWKEER